MRNWSFALVTIAIIFFAYHKHEKALSTQVKEQIHQPPTLSPLATPLKTNKYPPVTRPQRVPAAVGAAPPPEKIRGIVVLPDALTIGKSFKLVDGIRALSRSSYSAKLGIKISEDRHFIFYRPAVTHQEALPVALNSSRQKLYPVSHILHLKGVESDLRNQFKAAGMREYYYHGPLKLLSVEASPTTVLKQYAKLKSQGFDVRLEVLQEPPRAY